MHQVQCGFASRAVKAQQSDRLIRASEFGDAEAIAKMADLAKKPGTAGIIRAAVLDVQQYGRLDTVLRDLLWTAERTLNPVH